MNATQVSVFNTGKYCLLILFWKQSRGKVSRGWQPAKLQCHIVQLSHHFTAQTTDTQRHIYCRPSYLYSCAHAMQSGGTGQRWRKVRVRLKELFHISVTFSLYCDHSVICVKGEGYLILNNKIYKNVINYINTLIVSTRWIILWPLQQKIIHP